MNTLKKLNFSKLMALFPARKKDIHKGECGNVVIIGGNEGMAGAPVLAAQAAYRVGAGRVIVATRAVHKMMATLMCPEVQTEGVEEASQLKRILEKATVVAVGPGLGQDEWAVPLLQTLLLDFNLPLVVDADALRLLVRFPQTRDNWVLTPHLGEAAALLKSCPIALKAKREEAVMSIQSQYGGTVILKGHHTLVSSAKARTPMYCAQGNPGMASAGMGDVLTGVIVGLMAQGLENDVAAALGVVLHAKAGDSAAKLGERGLMASDLLPHLRDWVNAK
ncbi:MAG: NAD(P)H-hydrate dehydratase [Gammaproteobacteria bacterium]|nr:NAD(P)H-hydrate dehydratase [Gammaproteobacteria bacterium]